MGTEWLHINQHWPFCANGERKKCSLSALELDMEGEEQGGWKEHLCYAKGKEYALLHVGKSPCLYTFL